MMIRRDDLRGADSPEGMEVYQLQREAGLPVCHVYMESQVSTLDSRFFLFQEGVETHGSDHRNPQHRYLLCDLEDGEVYPVTDETGVTAPAVSPCGNYFYYFIDQTEPGSGRILLKRRQLDGSRPETLYVLDHKLKGTPFHASKPYSISTISSNGSRLAISCFLGNGLHEGASFGLLIFDLNAGGKPQLILQGPSWCNMHAQYSRSLDADKAGDLLIQENHGAIANNIGKVRRLGSGMGADVHFVRDDGQYFRTLPGGRTMQERITGHQCWRGRSEWVVASTTVGDPKLIDEKRCPIGLLETRAVPFQNHEGKNESPDAHRHFITRDFEPPHFNHFATDLYGTRLISDYRSSWNPDAPMKDALYLMELGTPGEEAARKITFLLNPMSSWKPSAHVHPFLSPDGKTAFFNSDESGVTQAYVIRNLPEI